LASAPGSRLEASFPQTILTRLAREAYQQAFAKGFVTDYPLTIRDVEGRLSHVLYNRKDHL
jgi:hypothetical protein